MLSVINMQDPAEVIAATIGVVVVAILASCYLSGKIFNPSPPEEVEEIRLEPQRPRRHDSWGGFEKAHQENPPAWVENDSWSAKFTPR